jgi:putative ABC transport system permease protein
MLAQLLSDIRYRVRALFRRDAVERELDDELRFHIENEAATYMRDGVSRAEAHRRARLAFGGMDRIKDDTRDARGLVLLETTWQDLRYALRGLRARPAFTLGVILTLALGIGANASMFAIVDRLIFRAPFALHDPDTVHRVYYVGIYNNEVQQIRNLSFPVFLDLKRQTQAFSQIAAFQTRTLAVGDGEDAHEVPVTVASASYFRFFDALPAIGRFFTAEEDSVPAGAPVVVLGYTFWQTHFGGSPDVIGKPLRVDRTLATIVGVAPEHFVGMSDQGVPAAYMPITAYAYAFRGSRYTAAYGWSWLEIIARRKPGVSPTAAETDLTAALQQSWRAASALGQEPGDIDAVRPHGELAPLQLARGPDASRDARVALWINGVALIVLLVACANVANLLLARAVSRQREVSMRIAFGVSRLRLVRQLFTESLVLALAGGAAGLAIAQWGASVLGTLFLPGEARAGVLTDGRTLLFAAAATMGAALLTGLAPAFSSGRGDLTTALRTGAREGTYRRGRLQTALVVFQAALSVVLLVGAGLFVRSLQHVRGYRLGYDVEPVLFAAANPRGTRLSEAELPVLLQRMLAAAQSMPGVTRATLAASVPFWSNEGRGLWVPGVDSVRKLGTFILQAGSPDYFATLGTRILRGRGFEDSDRATTPRVAVVSEGMARVLWPGRDAIGQCFRIGSDTVPCSTVVGVAEEAHIRQLAAPREYTYYIPITQYDDAPYPQMFVRYAGHAAEQAEALRRRLQVEMPGAAYVNVVPLSKLVDPNFRAWQFGATMFVAFGVLALCLAAIGLYAMIAYDVAQRTQEIGVRLALGASLRQVMQLVVAGGTRLIIIGIVIGSVIALWTAHWIEGLMFRQSPRDPAVFGVVVAVLVVVALAATAIPALRAARVDPNVALRGD